MDIYLVRHGKAQERAPTMKGDASRKLTEAGKKELACISKAVNSMGVEPDRIVSSPLLRAKQTAQIVASRVKSKKRSVAFWDELKPESTARDVLARLSALRPDDSLLLVGHEPLLGDLIGSLVFSGNGASIPLKKGGFAHLQCMVADSEISGVLRSLLTPKQLRLLCR